MRVKTLISFFILAILAGLFACTEINELDELDVRTGQQRWAIPLASSTLSIDDLLNEISDSTDVLIDSVGRVHLQYNGDILKKTALEILPPLPTGLPIEVPDTNFIIDLPFKDLIVTDMRLRGDSMFYLFRSELEEDIDVSVTIPALTLDGKPYSASTTIIHDPNRANSFDQAIVGLDLEGYRLQMDSNRYRVVYNARRMDGSRIKLSKVLTIYSKLDFSYVEGFFSKDNYEIPRDTISIDVYDRVLPGELFFEAPSVSITVTNAFGFPLETTVKELSLKGKNGQFIELESPYIREGFFVDYPRLNEVGGSRVTEFVFDTSNSNIKEIFNSQPVEMDYEITAISNPDEDNKIIGFLQDDSEVRINVKVDLPVHGRAKDFLTTSEFDLDIGNDNLKSMEVKWISENNLPVGMDAQVYFYDQEDNVIDSLFYDTPLVVDAAAVDINDKVLETAKNLHIENITGERLDRMRMAEKGEISLKISTYEASSRSVRILKDQYITIKIGAIIETE